jgi:hypothetical protein
MVLLCNSLSALEGKAICTKARNIQDQWSGILHNRPPVTPLCLRVVRLEPFYVNVFFLNPTIKDGKVHVSAKLKMQTPDGKIRFESNLKPQIFPCKSPKSVFLFAHYLGASFDPPDAIGEYVFTADIKDENSGDVTTATAKIQLQDKILLPPDKKPLAALTNYYRNPAPQNILPGFKEFLKMLPGLKKKQGKNFNPLSSLALFFYLLQINPQLHPDFAKLVDGLQNPGEQLMGVIIMHELGKKAFALLSEKARSRWNPGFSGAFRITDVKAPWQLDVLWSEFLVTGKKAPLQKIVGEVHKIQGNLSVEDYKKLAKPAKKDRDSLIRFLTGMAAAWSLGSNAKQHRLVAFYLEAMLSRGEIKDPFTNVVIAKKLQDISQPQKPVQKK